ncbi:DEAD/DEAH box helicase, partial [Klebsiella pneumoniae]|uniref:DEAD/DEAH box helicase n=1 Tax=Klebsiella pneumoniae TaxID=573 RepID=UPI0038549F63
GTGKTLSYLLPSLRQWEFSKEAAPRILILVPTRELVVQVVETARELSRYMSVKTVGVYGGANIKTQMAALHEGADIVVGTPGR